jgi:hypothetical protein
MIRPPKEIYDEIIRAVADRPRIDYDAPDWREHYAWYRARVDALWAELADAEEEARRERRVDALWAELADAEEEAR